MLLAFIYSIIVIIVLGFSIGDGPLLLASFNSALFSAALNEELAKLIFTLIVIIIFRKSIRNVYEYILVGGAVGFGFTIVEEYIYSSEIIGLQLHFYADDGNVCQDVRDEKILQDIRRG